LVTKKKYSTDSWPWSCRSVSKKSRNKKPKDLTGRILVCWEDQAGATEIKGGGMPKSSNHSKGGGTTNPSAETWGAFKKGGSEMGGGGGGGGTNCEDVQGTRQNSL